MATVLCSYCSKINFQALRFPYSSDIPAIENGTTKKSSSTFFQKLSVDGVHKMVSLGSLRRIISDAASCRLCHHFLKILTQDGQYPKNGLTPEGGDFECQAECNFYGVFRERQSEGDNHWLRRLSIIVRKDEGDIPYGSHFCFQACETGAVEREVDATFGDGRTGIDRILFGGRKRPLVLQMEWVQRWLKTCLSDHDPGCTVSSKMSVVRYDYIRFIDTKRNCIATFRDGEISKITYIALSYVWGRTGRLTTRSDNIHELEQPGSLESKPLSVTVADTIRLTKILGIRYLWVDALCIIQDDNADKSNQIALMSAIYGCAYLTVVAASGNHADAGLPGMRPGTRFKKQEEIAIKFSQKVTAAESQSTDVESEISLLTTLNPLRLPSTHYLDATTWSTRGWTMQERVLSRRNLIFTPEQVFWVCNSATFCEESYFEHPIKFHRFHRSASELTLQIPFRNFYDSTDLVDRFWSQYQDLVCRFTQRKFTYEGDVHDAFSAILDGLGNVQGETFIWGMPRSRFELALSWKAFYGQRRRRQLSTLPMTPLNVRVAFPSWSWMGWIGETWVSVRDNRAELGDNPEIKCYIHHTSPLRVEQVNPVPGHGQHDYDLGNPSWKPSRTEVTFQDLTTYVPSLSLTRLSLIPDKQLLFFWTSSVQFRLHFIIRPSDDGTLEIYDTQGDKVGDLERILEEETCNEGDLIVIGSIRTPVPELEPLLTVLHVVDREGIKERVNIGQVKETAWIKAEPVMKLVALG